MNERDTLAAVPATLDRVRAKGIRAWALTGWIALLALIIHDIASDTATPLPLLLAIGIVINVLPTVMALRHRHDAEARLVMGALAAVLPAVAVFQLQGHAWQMDAHMFFFVAMAALVVLGDWRPIAVATVLTALHHLVLAFLAPGWVFAGAGDLGRVMFHAVAVLLQFGVLAMVTVRLERLLGAQDRAIARARRLTTTARDERERAEQALGKAHEAEAVAASERTARAAASARAAGERRGELVTLANEFDHSVTSVVKAIGVATEQLEASAMRLGDSTRHTDAAVCEVTAGAARAADEITLVTGAIQDLSQSIRTIALAAADQSSLTTAASGEAESSVRTIAHLEHQADQIESLVDAIREIAGKTNLLALNATIEAARAGEAGRGFTVVAGEVKTLATDTARISDTISGLLAGIRVGVADSAATLRGVNDAIGQVACAAGGIATAVEDHRATANDVHVSADRAMRSANDIELRIGAVAEATGVASTLCASLRSSAAELSATARQLRTSTDLFVGFLDDDQGLAA
ncbi:chemotaxis protein [Sphingomonas sp. Leaf33]|uniref:methyl-accepting chemotaxis protein n=1 Tax=Sphingomonas sp. Leaf33 TaxID=1736215 RepID=UPI0007023C97|nr:methyl-accepting chemotaxis protein [Sphingomonas sp. Leaf33]KQN25873.1 chemotaxis protein [Sphingomonas sp. Leaf33]